MLTIQKWVATGRLLSLTMLLALAACMPAGPRALLTGERLLKEGKHDAAVAALTEATVLLPRNAQAWNHLGLASHRAGRPNEAIRAYRKALEVDVNLAPARFNLGCLFLELNQPAFAMVEFAAYTVMEPKSVDGWLKRGRAELLARQFDAAAKSHKAALALNPKQPEVWNTLGIVELFRNRIADSFQAFNNGVQQDAAYAPALFNAAVVSHHYLPRRPVDHRPFALQRYKDFLALNPPTDQLSAVQQIAAALEAEISPRPPAPKPVPVAPTNSPVAVAVVPKPEPVAPAPVVKPVPAPEPASTPPPPVPVVVTPKPSPKPAVEPVKPVLVAAVVKPPATKVEPPAPAPPAPVRPAPPEVKPAPPVPVVPVFRPEPPAPAPAPEPVRRPPPIAPNWTGPRYTYLHPSAPSAGTRADAQTHFQLGQSMQRIGKYNDAVAAYQRAIRADGAFFEAYHNLGTCAAQMGDLLKATAAYETALALDPASNSTRYNFALALQRGGQLLDAAHEMERVLEKSPDDAGAHFTLANLYSQQFGQPTRARPHYLRVLELRPQHPQATAIRFWLRENP